MSIITKTGDHGETGLLGGGRVPKTDLRIAAIGDVDELNAHMGKLDLPHIQEQLFELGAALADPKSTTDFWGAMDTVELIATQLEKKLPELKNFILPGGTPAAVEAHIARAVCRRAERSLCRLAEKESIPKNAVPYLNRLSDYLFMVARNINHDAGVEEIVWKS